MQHFTDEQKEACHLPGGREHGTMYEREVLKIRDAEPDENGFVQGVVKGEWTLHEEERMLKATAKIKGVPAMVKVEIGATINIDNWESMKLTVGITQPVNASPSEIEKARDDMTAYLSDYIIAKKIKIVGTTAQRAAMVKAGRLRLDEFTQKTQAEIRAHMEQGDKVQGEKPAVATIPV